MALPQGYTQVEYIESTGTQYIDTKVEAPGGFRAVINVYFTKISADSGILGAYDATSPYNRNFIACNTSQWLFGAYGYAYVGTVQAGTNYTLDVNTAPGSLSLTVNGVKASFQISEDAGGRSNKSLYLLALNTGAASIPSSARVGGGQIYNSNGVLVRDYIPCRNPDGAAGLYDMVGGQFYGNDGTGEFVCGRAVALPEHYKRLAYIESTGTQFINTRYKPNNNTRLVMDCTIENPVSSNYITLFGARDADLARCFALFVSPSNNFYPNIGIKTDYYTYPTSVSVVGHHVIDVNKNTITIDENSHTFTARTFQNTTELFIFANNENNSTAFYGAFKVGAVKIYDNGTLVRDYIPCQTDTGEVGLYDMATATFYGNDGTGEFIAGPEVVFPSKYKQLEYIESTGQQFVNTEFKPNQNSRIIMDCLLTTTPTSNAALFGARNGSSAEFWALYRASSSKFAFRYGGSGTNHFIAGAATERHKFDLNKNTMTVDDAAVTVTSETFSSAYNTYLFAVNDAGTVQYPASMRLYRCQVYNDVLLVRDYIPCQTDTGEIGLYDMESETFYGNAGTGEFLAGRVIAGEDVPDVPEALEYTLAGNIVVLTWSASSGAEKYRVYRDYSVIAETTSTEHIDTFTDAPEAHVYAVTAVNEYGESDFSEIVRAEFWGDTAPELIYDRTQADVDDAKALISKCMRGEVLDGYEQEMWERGLRGCYNTSDVNRVEYHTRELQNILNANGYNIQIDTRLWAKPDIMRYSDIVRYLGNINAILDAFGRSANAPKLPGIDRWIDYIAANDIEKILYVTRELIYGALAMFRRAGTFRAGGDYLAQVIRRA